MLWGEQRRGHKDEVGKDRKVHVNLDLGVGASDTLHLDDNIWKLVSSTVRTVRTVSGLVAKITGTRMRL